MNAIEILQNNILQQQQVLDEIEAIKKDRDFLLRILTQAVLTNDGILKVNSNVAELAFEFMNTKKLEFVNDSVCFYGEKGSLFDSSKE